MNEKDKNIVSKLDIIKEMASSNEVKQLAEVVKEYVKGNSKQQLGFNSENSKGKE